MKHLFFFLSCLLSGTANAQILSFGASPVTLKSGTTIVVDNLTLIPSADFTISNNTLSKATTIVNASANPYISRVYRFASTTPAYSGSVQINYLETELNGIAENALTLNIHNGTSWSAYAATTRDATNNFVLTNGISNVVLNELTLANQLTPLPLTWLSFTATKQNQTALLKWSTTQEQNTRDFSVQHSTNGINWTAIGNLQAAGNSTATRNYSYVHSSPVTGVNYYRILQADMDNRSSYSAIRTLLFTKTNEPFTILGNPVTNGVLMVQVNEASSLALYTADGKLLWQENVNAGTKTFDMSRYAKGAYLLKANNKTQKVVIQ